MGANDSPTTTRAIVTDYFDWRLNQKTPTSNRLFLLVRRFGSECEQAARDKQPSFNFHFPSSSSSIDVQTLNHVKTIHTEIAREMFSDAECILRQHPNDPSTNLLINSIIDWTTDFIDHDLQTWLQSQNYWAGCQKVYDKTPQRRNSISRYAGILGTIGVLTLGALYMRRL